MTKVPRKFYVGHPRMVSECLYGDDTDWSKKTLKDAVTHASKLARETGKPQIVVKVVAIVEVEEPPVTIEKVR